MFVDARTVLAIDLHRRQDPLCLKTGCQHNSIGRNNTARQSANTIFGDLSDWVIVDQVDIRAVQAGEISRVIDPAFASNLRLRDQEVSICCRRVGSNVSSGFLRPAYSDLCAGGGVEALEALLLFLVQHRTICAHCKRHPLHSPLKQVGVLWVLSLCQPVRLATELGDFLGSFIAFADRRNDLRGTAAVS